MLARLKMLVIMIWSQKRNPLLPLLLLLVQPQQLLQRPQQLLQRPQQQLQQLLQGPQGFEFNLSLRRQEGPPQLEDPQQPGELRNLRLPVIPDS